MEFAKQCYLFLSFATSRATRCSWDSNRFPVRARYIIKLIGFFIVEHLTPRTKNRAYMYYAHAADLFLSIFGISRRKMVLHLTSPGSVSCNKWRFRRWYAFTIRRMWGKTCRAKEEQHLWRVISIRHSQGALLVHEHLQQPTLQSNI